MTTRLCLSVCGSENHSTFLLQCGLNAPWRPFNFGPPTRNLSHPTSFSPCSRSSLQFSGLHSEILVFRLWKCTEYTCPCFTWSCLVSNLGLRVISLRVLPRLGFEQGDGDAAEKCMFQVVLGDSMQEMTTCDWLVFPGRGWACPKLCQPSLQRSSQHVPSKISFLILFPCWPLYWSLPHSRNHGGIHFQQKPP